MKTPWHIPLVGYDTFDEFLSRLPKHSRLTGIELDAKAKPIQRFVHPEQAVYLLGAEDYGLPQSILGGCHAIVQLPGDLCLNVAVAGSIVMFDRINKALAPE